jgi:hypothetical protein
MTPNLFIFFLKRDKLVIELFFFFAMSVERTKVLVEKCLNSARAFRQHYRKIIPWDVGYDLNQERITDKLKLPFHDHMMSFNTKQLWDLLYLVYLARDLLDKFLRNPNEQAYGSAGCFDFECVKLFREFQENHQALTNHLQQRIRETAFLTTIRNREFHLSDWIVIIPKHHNQVDVKHHNQVTSTGPTTKSTACCIS